MENIVCPHCGEQITIDENSYADILRQVHTKEFKREVEEKLKNQKENFLKDKKLEEAELRAEFENQISKMQQKKAEEILKMEHKHFEEKQRLEKEESDFKGQLERDLAKKQAEIESLKNLVDNGKTNLELAVERAKSELKEELTSKNQEILNLDHQIKQIEAEKNSMIKEVKLEQEKNLASLTNELQFQKSAFELEKNNLMLEHEHELKQKDTEIDFYKDLKAKQSTKMVGESLEQHCELEFNKLRMTAFKNAYFAKDNDAKSGSKGDYIYREVDDYDQEIISIMFEMKNESDQTASKKKNEHFFKELDKDRRQKDCEYAILVSLLEADDDLYNTGIVDVSYKYEKMYVIRPQFFIPMITLLRNAALNSMKYRQELAQMRKQNEDVTNFERELGEFKKSFGITAKNFNGNLEKLDKELEKSIKSLTTARDELRKARNNLGTAENKLDNLTIKKLTRNNPTMQEKFDALNH
ncbi:DUF2130 domain-containing protein [Streptococcaceae bacterium ESL0729]|nr:DUF2130 domain-containing protein [Streptococcaceae bacterium ESL0729]